ncbi:MAG: putative DNA-binding protein [Clostridia bacterium]|nr:putative DNA-binding protein [Clostridia bacterium]
MAELQSEVYEISMLLDFYGQLLTESQYNVMDMHYNQDLSLTELAEALQITRQGAHDFIKRGKKQLLEFEEKLGLLARFREARNQLESLQEDFQLLDRSEMEGGNAYLLEQIEEKLYKIISDL